MESTTPPSRSDAIDHDLAGPPPDEASAPTPPPQPAAAATWQWLVEGLRAGFFLAPRVGEATPAPAQMAGLLALVTLCSLGLGRLEIPGDARLDTAIWLASWWIVAPTLLLAWNALRPRSRLAAWVVLWMLAEVPVIVVSNGLAIARAHGLLPAALTQNAVVAWGLYLALLAWSLGTTVVLAWRFGAVRARLGLLAFGYAGLMALSAAYLAHPVWTAARTAEAPAPQLVLSQQVFEAQQQAWQSAIDALPPQRPGVADVYGLVFAPYAGEDVFLRESGMVAEVIASRFDAQGRVLRLINHATTAETEPWATPANLVRAIAALAARMDRDEDLLVVYLTSHGARDFQLAAEHWPLQVDSVTPQLLREALDQAGVRHRVIAVSACFSGGWIGPLATPDSLVMTAADATHTSYGCGRLSELTFFGRAVFHEQLREHTRSFEQAFAAAVPLIRQREIDAGKSDGFSNPQIHVGEGIRPLLERLATPR